MRAVGLFSGIGGFELGLEQAGVATELMCEHWNPAATVLRRRFDSELVGDIRDLKALPATDIVTAGFPCTDLSQVGRAAGIDGDESGLIKEVFRLVKRTPPTWLVLENVPNMLSLHGGSAMRFITDTLDDSGWNWAYRTVDSQHFGVRQRRRRVFLVASPNEDPRGVLFADEALAPRPRTQASAYGFYWTEGNRGLGWGRGVTPTLKGGSAIGIPSPPGVWVLGRERGTAIASPSIAAGERLQGFRAGWTSVTPRLGDRWKMVGNAVTVPVARWLGERLQRPDSPAAVGRRSLAVGERWPPAASSLGGFREAWTISERPRVIRPAHGLADLLNSYGAQPLTFKATSGFAKRLKASRLNVEPGFLEALDAHLKAVS